MLPWILSSAAKDEDMEVRRPKVKLSFGFYTMCLKEWVEEMHNSLELGGHAKLLWLFSLQRDIVDNSDYDIIQDSSTDLEIAPKAEGKVHFNR